MTVVELPALIGGLLLLSLTGLLVYLARKWKRIARLIREIETSQVANLRDGLVEIQGKVRAGTGDLLQSPVSRKPCVYFKFEVKEKRTTGTSKNRRSRWVTRINDESRLPFEIDDGTGSVRVQPEEASIDLAQDQSGRSGLFNDPTPELEAAMEHYGRSTRGLFTNRTLRWKEHFLEEGDSLYVLGSHANGCIGRGPDGVFVISDRGEERALRSYWWSFVLAAAGSLAALALGIYLIAFVGLSFS